MNLGGIRQASVEKALVHLWTSAVQFREREECEMMLSVAVEAVRGDGAKTRLFCCWGR